MSKRRPLNQKQRANLFYAHQGICHICSGKIGPEQWEVEHIIPIAMGGDDELSNMAPAHIKCHRVKSKTDAHNLAKSNSVRAKHFGFKAKSSKPLPCGKDSPWKKTFNNGVVRRVSNG